VRRLVWSDLSDPDRKAALSRPRGRSDPALQQQVRAIVDDVAARGWAAVAEIASRLDGAEPRRVATQPIAEEARRTLATEQLRAIELARKNVAAFHSSSLPAEHAVETMPGLVVRKIWRPLDSVGLYVPGGKTPLFSTLMMLAIPAKAAGVGEIVVVTPPRPDGSLDPVLALAADICGIANIWTIGGAQAIAALAFGAGEIPAVPKICGPGNAWVAEAKTYVASLPGGPAIDLPAGPSELLVIADNTADPRLVAADLLSQAEHDEAAQVILVTNAPALADTVEAEVASLLATLPRRATAEAALENARIVLTDTLDEAVAAANLYAPEHLSLAVADPDALLGAVRNAGAVFAGGYAAETFGDYLAGSSHVLPTDGAARVWSGISVHAFLKSITVQQVSADAARAIARPAAALARLEGLEAHARAADARLLPPLPFGGGDRGVGDVGENDPALEAVAGTSPTPTHPLKGRGL
jgi:histidinol dehydrogenase